MRALLVAVVVSGCGSDAANKPADDSGSFDPSYEAIGCGAEVPSLELELLPMYGFAFRHVASKCETLASEFLLKNTGETPMRLDTIGIAPPFELGGFVPAELDPQASISVTLGFNASVPMERTGKLAVLGPDGCREFEVRGQSVNAASMQGHPLYGRAVLPN